MKRKGLALGVVLVALLLASVAVAHAGLADWSAVMLPGENARISCAGGDLQVAVDPWSIGGTNLAIYVHCLPLTPTATATPPVTFPTPRPWKVEPSPTRKAIR